MKLCDRGCALDIVAYGACFSASTLDHEGLARTFNTPVKKKIGSCRSVARAGSLMC